MKPEISVRGVEQVQRKLAKLGQDVTPVGKLQIIIGKATLRAHAYASKIVHVLTGRLKNSLFPRVSKSGNQAYGVVGTNVIYALAEHERGGDHAFFARTASEDGPGIVQQIDDEIAAMAREANGG